MIINKEGIALFLVSFWLFLPIPLMIFDVGGYQEIATNTNILNIYFQLLIFNIPGASFVMLRIVNLLQVITLLVSYLLVFK